MSTARHDAARDQQVFFLACLLPMHADEGPAIRLLPLQDDDDGEQEADSNNR